MKLIIIFFLILKIIKSFTIPLYTENGIPVISLKIGKSERYINMFFDTSLHRSLLVSPYCNISIVEGYNTSNSKKILSNQKEIKYYYTFYGDEFEDNIQLITKSKTFESKFSFISFTKVLYTSQIAINGFFGLSFTNYNFNTSKKIFGLQYYSGRVLLDLGEINSEIVKNYSLLKNYSVSYNDNKSNWYLKANSIMIKNNEPRNKEIQKLIFDTTTYNLYIPKKFFFDNIDLILPINGKCQVQMSGIFLCYCNENYKNIFPYFKFIINGEILFVNVTDYISFDNSIAGNTCYVSIIVNYNNDFWILGNNILNNYYSIFDIDNNQFRLYDRRIKINKHYEFSLIFIFTLIFMLLILLAGYLIYKKYTNENHFEEQLI